MQPQNTSVTMAPRSHVAYPVSPGTTVYPAFKPKANLALGIIQVITGLICLMFQLIGIAIRSPNYYVGTGIWGGIPFVIAGVFGILASKSKSRCTVIALMVMSIISAVLAGVMVMNQSFAIAFADDFYYEFDYYRTDRYKNQDARSAMNVILLLAALTEMVVAITQAAFCCGATCCSSQSAPATQVLYANQPPVAQSNVIYTQGIPQNQLQPAPGQQLFVFSQGQFMPVVALPQGSVAPTMVAGPGYQMPPAPNSVHQIQVQSQPQPQSYPQSMQDNEKNEAQMTTAQSSPPPAYVSNPDLQQPQANLEETARTDAGQTPCSRGQWEQF